MTVYETSPTAPKATFGSALDYTLRQAFWAAATALTPTKKTLNGKAKPKTRLEWAGDMRARDALVGTLFNAFGFRPAYRPEKAARLGLAFVATEDALRVWLEDEVRAETR